jgi:hypothetical protein
LYISVTIIIIRRNYSLLNQSSSANQSSYCVQACVLQCSSCLLEQGLLRPRDKISLSPANPYTGDNLSNCNHPTPLSLRNASCCVLVLYMSFVFLSIGTVYCRVRQENETHI